MYERARARENKSSIEGTITLNECNEEVQTFSRVLGNHHLHHVNVI